MTRAELKLNRKACVVTQSQKLVSEPSSSLITRCGPESNEILIWACCESQKKKRGEERDLRKEKMRLEFKYLARRLDNQTLLILAQIYRGLHRWLALSIIPI